MYKKRVKVYISTYISLIAILIALLTIYFKINNIQNPDKSIFKNEVKREQPPYTYPIYILGSSNIINGYDPVEGMIEIDLNYEIIFYFNTSSNYLIGYDFNIQVFEIVNDIEIENYSKNYTYNLDTNISVYDIDTINTYIFSSTPYEEAYELSYEIYITDLNEKEHYYEDTLLYSYIGDFAFLEYSYSKPIDIYYTMPQYVFVDSYNSGETNGYLKGYESGQENGYQIGYTEGYDTGVQDTISEGDRFSLAWLEPLFQITTDFLNIEILPGFKLIYFVTIPLFFSLIYMILKLFR